MNEVKHSEQLGELAAALSAFQGEVMDAVKDTQGYGYKYAKLDGVLEIVRPLLAKNGLAITQHCGNALESAAVHTMLLHKSGQWMHGIMSMPVVPVAKQSHAQATGATISYIRRYAITAMLGVTQTDDDAACHSATVKSAPASFKTLDVLKVARMKDLIVRTDSSEAAILSHYQVSELENLSEMQFINIVKKLESKIGVKNDV